MALAWYNSLYMLERAFDLIERHLKPSRHEFDPNDDTGIRVAVGRTIITASVASHKDPYNEKPTVDLSAKENAVWLTHTKKVEGRSFDFIIGPDGTPSPIAIRWSEGVPKVYMISDRTIKRLEEVNENDLAEFINTPAGSSVALLTKRYVQPNPEYNFREFYGIMRMPGMANLPDQSDFRPYLSKETLISGMNNRGMSRYTISFLAVRATNKSNLPFGRDQCK